MGRYNGHFTSKFHGCMIVGRQQDVGRQREVVCYAIADEPEVVGFFDGIDTWVGSAGMCSKAVQQELMAVHRGETREVEQGQTRDLFNGEPGATQARRRAQAPLGDAAALEPLRTARRRVVVTPVPVTRERRRAV